MYYNRSTSYDILRYNQKLRMYFIFVQINRLFISMTILDIIYHYKYIQIVMQKSKNIAIIAVLLICKVYILQASLTNTTDFYNTETGKKLPYQSFSGFEDINWYFGGNTAAMYYSLWQGNNLAWEDKTVPFIIWFQGGPGRPSQFGCFNQIGPLLIQGDASTSRLVQNNWPLNSFGHVLCVDQLGVGFSYNRNSKPVDNTMDAANYMINFLSNFFRNNPKLGLIGNPLYLAGQSYAGHSIPAVGQKIVKNNTLGFNLKGIMIGGGWVDPLFQNNYFDSYLNTIGVVSNQWRDTTTFMQNQAINRIMNSNFKDASNYTIFITSDADDMVSNQYYNGMNPLNYKQQYSQLNANSNYWRFLENKKKSLGVPDAVSFVPLSQSLYYAFSDDFSRSFTKSLGTILTANVRALIFNGQNDFISNTPGVLAYLNTVNWPNEKNWKSKEKVIWKNGAEGISLGWYKSFKNLIFVLIRNAGHLTPLDQPKSTFLMLNKYFIENEW